MTDETENPAAAQQTDARQNTGVALPDRLSVNPRSPHHNEEVLSREVGIRFNGQEKTNVEEYCVSEGWIKVAVGTTLDRKGNPLTMKFKGKVEPYYRDEDPG